MQLCDIPMRLLIGGQGAEHRTSHCASSPQGAAESNGSLLNDLIGVKGRIILETIIKMLKYILVVNFVRVQVFTLVGQ